MKRKKIFKFFEVVLIMTFLSSCVGSIEDLNPETTKSATTAGEPVSFSGIVDAVAISDSKVMLSFLPAVGLQSNLVYLIYINNTSTPLEVKGGSLSADESGYYTYTVTDLIVNRSYSFAIGVRDLTTGIESDDNTEMFATTFSNYTADFDGIGNLYASAGEAGQREVVVEWIPAVTEGAGSFPKATDPIAYEIRYMKADKGSPTDLKNSANGDVTVAMVPTSISSSSAVSEERSRNIGGLTPGTKYYFMVRCIHSGYADYGEDDSNYKVEENLKVLSVTTTEEGGLLEWDNESVKVESPDGEEGLTKADVSWDKASGPFKFYRLFYVKIGDADALDLNGDGSNDKTFEQLVEEAPELDNDYLLEIVNGTTTETTGYHDIDSDTAYYRLGSSASLTSYGYYLITTYVCTSADCAEGFRIAGNEVAYRVTPPIAPFSGLLAIKSPENLTQVNNPGSIDTVTVTFDAPVISAGYVNKFELYCFSSLSDTSPTLLDVNVANTSGKDGCNGLVRTTETPTGLDAIGEFGEIEVTYDFIASGSTASSRQYCFGAIPVIESANYVRRDIGNATVRCKTIEIKVPSLDEFPGVADVCNVDTTSLTATWSEPLNGIYNNYEIFWKEVDGNGFKFSDATAGDAAYSSADSLSSSTLSYEITGLIPGKSYQYGVLTYLDDGAGNKTYSEFNAGTKSCSLNLPEPKFGEWVDLFAIGPKEDGRVPLEDSTGKRTFLFETIDSMGQAIEVEVDDTLNPTSEHINLFGDNSISTSIFDGVWGKPDADEESLISHRYSNSGIIRIMWKDVTFDSGTKSLSDYIGDFSDDVETKSNRKFGYKVLRSEDEGISWSDLTSSDYAFQTSSNSGFIHPKDFIEYPRTNVETTPDAIKVGEFIDYSVKYSKNSGNMERARTYWYKIITVFNGKEVKFERSQSNPQHIIKVVLPPPNMGLIHRLMANRQTCMELGKNYSPEIEDFYTCDYNGVGAKSLSTPWVVGSTVYDFGGNVLMDRYEMGCNYTRGDQTNTRSYFSGENYDFSESNSDFRGCLIPVTASSTSDNGGNTADAWESEKVYWVGDCLATNMAEIADSPGCNDPTAANPRDYITPGISRFGSPVDNCNESNSWTDTITNPYDSNTGNYKAFLAQSEYLAVLYNSAAKGFEYNTLIATNYHGAGGSSVNTSKHVTVSSGRVSRCMINIPVVDRSSLNGSGEARIQPRWLAANNLDLLTHDSVDIDILNKSVSEVEALVDSSGAAGNLFDTNANALPSASNYNTSYNARYDSTTPIAKIISSNKSKLPPLQGISQIQAEKVCDAYQVEIGFEKDDTFTASNGSYNKRLMRRTEGIVATAPPKMVDEAVAQELEDGSYEHTPVTSGSSFDAGCNGYTRDFDNFSGLSTAAGSPLTPHMTDTRVTGTNHPQIYTGSSYYDPSGDRFNTQACQGRYGIQDLMGNSSEYSSEHIFCDFSGETFYLGNGGTGTVSSSVKVSNDSTHDYNTSNVFPWIDSDPTTGRCSMAEYGAARDAANAPTENNIMLPSYDIFGNRNSNIILTPEFHDKTFMTDYRNGDGYFLDFGQGRIGAPLSIRDTLGINKFQSGSSLYTRSNSNSEPREGRYFNPVIGMGLSCYGDSCNSALDNKGITTERFVTDFSLTDTDFDIPNFPIRESEFHSSGMSEKINNTLYSLPAANDIEIDYLDTVTPNGVGGGVLNYATINLTTSTPLVIKRTYFELRRYASDTYGLYFKNFASSDTNMGLGRYTGVLGQEGYTNQMGVKKSEGFRCVVKFDEEVY